MEKEDSFCEDWSTQVARLALHGCEHDSGNVILIVGYPGKWKAEYVLSRAVLRLSSPRLNQLLENGPTLGVAYQISDVTPDQFECMVLHMHMQSDFYIKNFVLQKYDKLEEVDALVAVAGKYKLYDLIGKINSELIEGLVEGFETRNISNGCPHFDVLKILESNEKASEAEAAKKSQLEEFSIRNMHNSNNEIGELPPQKPNNEIKSETSVTEDIVSDQQDNQSEQIQEIRPNMSIISTFAIIIVAAAAIFIFDSIHMQRNLTSPGQCHVKTSGADEDLNNLFLNGMTGINRQLQSLTRLVTEHDKARKFWEKDETHFKHKINQDMQIIKTDLAGIKRDLATKIIKIGPPSESTGKSKHHQRECNIKGDFRKNNKADEWKLLLQESKRQGPDLFKRVKPGQRACAILIRNTASVELSEPVTYFLNYDHREYKRMPHAIAPDATISFAFSYSTDMFFEVINSFEILPAEANGGFAYHIGDATLVAKYTQQLNGANSFAIGFLDRNTALKRESLTRDWSRQSENVNVFSQAFEGQQATVVFRNLHVRASITSGSKAVLTILISEKQ